MYHALKEETWKLQHVINTVSLERSKIVASAKDILSLFSAYQNDGVTMLLRNFVVERLFDKGEESRETPVALSFAYLLCELASRDAAFVSVILGQLFSKCPLLIPSLDKEADLPPVLFEKHMRRYSMLVCMFAGLFIYTPLENANPFDIALMWKWLDAFISLYLDKPFLQFSGVMEPFLAIANSLLAKSDLHRLQDVLSRLKKEIVPQLENIPSLTSGSIMRLSYHLEDYEQGVFKPAPITVLLRTDRVASTNKPSEQLIQFSSCQRLALDLSIRPALTRTDFPFLEERVANVAENTKTHILLSMVSSAIT